MSSSEILKTVMTHYRTEVFNYFEASMQSLVTALITQMMRSVAISSARAIAAPMKIAISRTPGFDALRAAQPKRNATKRETAAEKKTQALIATKKADMDRLTFRALNATIKISNGVEVTLGEATEYQLRDAAQNYHFKPGQTLIKRGDALIAMADAIHSGHATKLSELKPEIVAPLLSKFAEAS